MEREDYKLFNFYVICFLHILLPFILLLSLNLLIIVLTKKRIYKKFCSKNFVEMPQISSLLRKG